MDGARSDYPKRRGVPHPLFSFSLTNFPHHPKQTSHPAPVSAPAGVTSSLPDRHRTTLTPLEADHASPAAGAGRLASLPLVLATALLVAGGKEEEGSSARRGEVWGKGSSLQEQEEEDARPSCRSGVAGCGLGRSILDMAHRPSPAGRPESEGE